jgi:hypothetical protein
LKNKFAAIIILFLLLFASCFSPLDELERIEKAFKKPELVFKWSMDVVVSVNTQQFYREAEAMAWNESYRSKLPDISTHQKIRSHIDSVFNSFKYTVTLSNVKDSSYSVYLKNNEGELEFALDSLDNVKEVIIYDFTRDGTRVWQTFIYEGGELMMVYRGSDKVSNEGWIHVTAKHDMTEEKYYFCNQKLFATEGGDIGKKTGQEMLSSAIYFRELAKMVGEAIRRREEVEEQEAKNSKDTLNQVQELKEEDETWGVNHTQKMESAYVEKKFPYAVKSWQGENKALDYYLNAPGELITYAGYDFSKLNRKNRRKVIRFQKNDSAGMYMYPCEIYPVSGGTDYGFFTSENDTVFAVFHYLCGPGCEISYGFLKCKDGKWLNVTDEVCDLEKIWPYQKFLKQFEKDGIPAIRFLLKPKENKIIIIDDENFSMTGTGKKLKELVFKNGKFVMK